MAASRPGFDYPLHVDPIYRAVPLDGVPTIPGGVARKWQLGYEETTPEEEQLCDDAIAAAKHVLDFRILQSLRRPDAAMVREARRAYQRDYDRNRNGSVLLGISDRFADYEDEEAA